METDLDPNPNNLAKVCYYEALGTLILVAGVNLTGGNAVAVGFTLFLAIQINGKVSGGHVNPAVSLAVFIDLSGT